MAIAYARIAMTEAKDKKRDVIDSPQIEPDATPDDILDVAVEYTFPASDPISVETAYRMALRKSAA